MKENNSICKLFNNCIISNNICISFTKGKNDKDVTFFKCLHKTNSSGFLYYAFEKMCTVSLFKLALRIRDNCIGEKFDLGYEIFINTGEDFVYNDENDVFIDNIIFGKNELFIETTCNVNEFINAISSDKIDSSNNLFLKEDNIVFGNCQFKLYPYVDDDKSINYIHMFENLLSFYCFIIYKYYIEENKQIFKYCKHCGKKFTPKKRSDSIYCSEKCRKIANNPSKNRIYGIYKYFRDSKKRYIDNTDILCKWADEIYNIRKLCEELTRQNILFADRIKCYDEIKKLGYEIPINIEEHELVDELFRYRNKLKKQLIFFEEPTDEEVENWFYKYIHDEWDRITKNIEKS